MRAEILALLLVIGCSPAIVQLPEEAGSIEVFFCDQADCLEIFKNKAAGNPVSCAMYHPSIEFAELAGHLVVDGDHPFEGAIVERGSGLMHNKFCIVNETHVWTGSWNPAQMTTIPNNVVFIESRALARAFLDEFEELSGGVFHGGASAPGMVILNGQLAEAYFCPEDGCKARVLDVLDEAEHGIRFMTYSFTDDDIGDLLLEKKRAGIDVKGVFDPRKDKHSEYGKLKGISTMVKNHHKVFIVDNMTVITGSYNPTRNGDERNDENILIVRDADVAAKFEKEFERLWQR